MGMIDEAICPLCGMDWCGRPCLRDPEKKNGLLFKRDGSEKSLEERGLARSSPALMIAPVKHRKREDVLSQLKVFVTRGEGPSVTEKRKSSRKFVTEIGKFVTENKKSVTEIPVTKKGRGRPVVEGSLPAAERARRYRERLKARKRDA